MAPNPRRQKVAILGGGVAGMTTAFWLTNTPELRDRYEVTLYQLGWRLGGKCASGRNLDQGGRIEEHGLHIWFGFYDNAFCTTRQCYEELEVVAPRPAECPIRTFDQAFAPSPVIGLYEHFDERWFAHRFDAPVIPRGLRAELGTMGPLPTLWQLVATVVEWVMAAWDDLRQEVGSDKELPKRHLRAFLRWVARVDASLDQTDLGVTQRVLDGVQRLAADLGHRGLRFGPTRSVLDRLLRTLVFDPLVAFKRELWEHVVQDHLDHEGLRFFFTTFDTMLTTLVGIVEEGVLANGFTVLDDRELSDFLRQHGAEAFTLDLDHSPFLRGWYDAAFAYRYVDGTRTPDLAAGSGVHGMLRLIGSYREAVAFKMQAGMGDTVFAPMYTVLRHRGVRFEFFSEVTRLELADDRTGVERVRLVRQAELAGDGPYDPLVEVAGLPCWPNQPRWEQLVGGDDLRRSGIDFEHGERAPGAAEQVLARGTDFDTVVLAIPAPALVGLCDEVCEHNPDFAAMLDHTDHTMTQAGQVWTTRTLESLGSIFNRTAVATSFVEPVDTYCDMSHLLPREAWGPDDPPQGVAYFCGVMPDQPTQAMADAAVARDLVALLDANARDLWPASGDGNGGFDWAVVHDPGGADGPARITAQYVRANFAATERYVLSPAGATRFRLPPDALVAAAKAGKPGGCDNLYLAGDWVLNGINGGCVEAATMSGMQACRAISGTPAYIAGENADWLSHIEL